MVKVKKRRRSRVHIAVCDDASRKAASVRAKGQAGRAVHAQHGTALEDARGARHS
jgi:hypothetical protein